MTWFSASIIIGMKRRDGKGHIIVHENVILVEATTAEEARDIAVKEGEAYHEMDDGFTIGGRPAVHIFAGVRKVMKVLNIADGTTQEDRALYS